MTIRGLLYALLLLITIETAWASNNATSDVAYLQEVEGDVQIISAGNARPATVGDVLSDRDKLTLAADSRTMLVIFADNFRMLHLFGNSPDERAWDWQSHSNKSRSTAAMSFSISKQQQEASVLRSDEAMLSWSLPRDTALAGLPLSLSWSTDEQPNMARVRLFDNKGKLIESFDATDSALLPRNAEIVPATAYTWDVSTVDGKHYDGRFRLLGQEELEAIVKDYSNPPQAVMEGGASPLIHYKALVLMGHELYLEAGGLLRDHLSVSEGDRVARSWRDAMARYLAQ